MRGSNPVSVTVWAGASSRGARHTVLPEESPTAATEEFNDKTKAPNTHLCTSDHSNYALNICVCLCKQPSQLDHSFSYLVRVHFPPNELGPPELQGLLQWEANAFEEEAVLHAAAVPQVVVLPQALVELPHAEREGLPGQLTEEKQGGEVSAVCGHFKFLNSNGLWIKLSSHFSSVAFTFD